MKANAQLQDRASQSRSRRNRAILAPLVVLAPIILAAEFTQTHVETPGPSEVAHNAAKLSGQIDPNVAPWWELTVLPRIGETLAKRIVAERDKRRQANPDSSPFRSADDLDAVRGIGPKTLDRFRNLIRLPANSVNQR